MKHLRPAQTLLALTLLTLPAFAQRALADPPGTLPPPAEALPPGPPMTAGEFEAYAVGNTLTYAQGGQVWGQEEYLPGHKVVWAFSGQPCEYGTWTEAPAQGPSAICFLYENNPDQNCWQFYRGQAGLIAVFLSGDGPALAEVAQTPKPMQCPGPKVGV
jgi:hypothetical protein